jgi:Holliday junction resolvasome RuvABC endonuclease subunit
MRIVIGIDPAATHLAAVILGGPKPYQLVTRTMPKDAVLRCAAAYRWTRRLIRLFPLADDIVVAVEEPVIGKPGRAGANGTLPQAKVHGAILAAGSMAAVTVIPINNSQWKKRIVGKGNASKAEVNQFVKRTAPKLWAEAKGNQDLCDALCIAQHGLYVVKLREKIDRTRRLRSWIDGNSEGSHS